jgi:uncharacterized membrane protein
VAVPGSLSSRSALALAALAAVLAAVLTLVQAPVLLRIPLGLLSVLVLPGYALAAALFPRSDDLDVIERLALGVGLSVAIIAVVAPGLSSLPWGLQPTPLVVTLTIWTVVTTAVAGLRLRQLSASQGASSVRLADYRPASRARKLALIGLVAAVLLAAGITGLVLGTPRSSTTEFYLLGPAGRAESYPHSAVPSEPLSVIVGITNEDVPASYAISVVLGQERLASVGPVKLAGGESWQGQIQFVLPTPGSDQMVQFLLYKNPEASPSRRLQLPLDVTPRSDP